MQLKRDRLDPLKEDFRNFLYVVWKHLGLPDPTPAQYQIAYYLQHGFVETYNPKVGRTDMIRAFRGIGKSYITAAFVLWCLYRDPVNAKIMVVSASGTKAKEFVSQVKTIMMTMPLLAGIRPTDEQRNSFDRFDVRGASIAQQPSVKAVGIKGQLPGNRATLIVADDIEVVENSRTEAARETVMRQINEFEAIKVPFDEVSQRPAADVIFLGTPQTEESIYNRLVRERGYNCFTIPARVPGPRTHPLENYQLIRDEDGKKVNILAPFVQELMDMGKEGQPTDPLRFSDEDLLSRESKGRSWFALQYMLDTTLSDAERYPLKQKDLVVMPLNAHKAPLVVQWGVDSDKRNVLQGIANVGFTGDVLLGPLFLDKDYRPYEGSVLFVDPSGRGADETAWAVIKVLNGSMYVTKVGGYAGDVQEAMRKVATVAREQNVNRILVEPNYAGQVWISAFMPILSRIWPGKNGEPGGCTVEESEWAKGQKEQRIIDTMEPVMNQHRLIIDEDVARDETFMYQLTHITRERGSLHHDDRLDAVAGAVAYFVKVLEMDAQQNLQNYKDQELQELLDDFMLTIDNGGSRFKAHRPDTEVYQFGSQGYRSTVDYSLTKGNYW